MGNPQDILKQLYSRRDDLNRQLKAVNQAIQNTQLAYGIVDEPTEPQFPILPIIGYSSDFPMDKKIYLILKELGEGTVTDIVKTIMSKESNVTQDVLTKSVSMGVSRLHTVGNPKYIPSNGGKIQSKPDPTDNRKKIYYL